MAKRGRTEIPEAPGEPAKEVSPAGSATPVPVVKEAPDDIPLGSEPYIHSAIFERLTGEDGTDLVGLVAYGLYQRRKRAWIASYRDRNGRTPSPTELQEHSNGYQDDALQALTSEARGILFRFSEEVIDAQIREIQGAAFNTRTQNELTDLKSRIDRMGGYRHHIVGHVLGFVVLVGIAAFFALVIWIEPSIEKVFRWLLERIRT